MPSRLIDAADPLSVSSEAVLSAPDATSFAEGSAWSLTSSVFRTPPFRATSTFTTSPGRRKAICCCSWPTYSTGFPSTATMMSPGSRPAFRAGEVSLPKSSITTPRTSGRPT